MSAAEQIAAIATGTPQKESGSLEPTVDEELSQQEEVDETPEASEETTEVEESEETEEELDDRVKEILKKNRKELREAKAELTALKKEREAKTAEPSEAADDKFKTLFINSAAKTALVEAGITTGTDRFLKMLDLSSVEVDESGAITGLDDQIADIKADFKDILVPKKTVTKVDGAGRREAPVTPKTSAEKLAARIG